MPGADAIAATVNRYVDLVADGNADEITALYADDATLEDPVGSDPRYGRAAIHDFYAAIENLDRTSELLSLRVAGDEAAFLWRLTLTVGDTRNQIEPIDTMTFDDDGKITSMRAYWSAGDMRVLK